MQIGQNIKRLRLEKNLKQRDLAQMAGISCSFLSEIESDRTSPSLSTLEKIAKSLEVSCAQILNE